MFISSIIKLSNDIYIHFALEKHTETLGSIFKTKYIPNIKMFEFFLKTYKYFLNDFGKYLIFEK